MTVDPASVGFPTLTQMDVHPVFAAAWAIEDSTLREETVDSYRVVRRLTLALVLLSVVAINGCATGGTSGEDDSSRNVITRSAIQDTDVASLYEVVRRLRPTWLRTRTKSFSRQTEIVVVRGGTVIGNVEMLRQMGTDGIQELRFMDGETAAATLVGARSGYVAGAIVIERG